MTKVLLPVTPIDAGQEVMASLVTMPVGTAAVQIWCIPASDALSMDPTLAFTIRYQKSSDAGITWGPYVPGTRAAGPLPDDLDYHAAHAVGQPGGSIPLEPGASFEMVIPGGALGGTSGVGGAAAHGDLIRAQVACLRVGGAALGLAIDAIDADGNLINW